MSRPAPFHEIPFEHAVDREGQLVGKHLGQGLAPCLQNRQRMARLMGLPLWQVSRAWASAGSSSSAPRGVPAPLQERPANSASMRA
jgi:hypothetical protein